MRLDARDWVSCCDTHLQGCCRGASVGGTRTQGAKKSEGRACAKVCGGCAHGKGRVRVCLLSLDLRASHRNHRQWAAGPFTLAPTLTLKVDRNGRF
jgi:hypothetical protein